MEAMQQTQLLPGLAARYSNRNTNRGIDWTRNIRISRVPPPSGNHMQHFSLNAACRKRPIFVANNQVFPRHVVRSGGDDGNLGKEVCLDDTNDITSNLVGDYQGSIRNEVASLTIPAIVGQAIDPVAQLMETAYIGRLGPVELASAAIGMSIFNIISKLFNVPLLSITTSFVAEDVSRNASSQLISDRKEFMSSEIGERRRLPSISSALLLAAGIGILEALALILWSEVFLNIMGVSDASAMRHPAKLFLSLRALGAPAVVVSLAVQGVFRGLKDTKTPLLYTGMGNISTLVLLPLLVYSLKLGITGAALATVASQYLTTFLLLWSLSKRAFILPPKIEDLQFVGYIKSGGMLLGRTLSVLITMTLGTAMAARQGTIAMAAHQICLQVWLAVSLLSDALAISAQALIASSFAEFDYKKVKEVTYYVLKTGAFVGIALALLLFASFGGLAELFSKDPMVLQIVKTGVLFVSASQPINALAFIFDGLHYGVSDFSYSASSMIAVGALSSLFLLYAPSTFGLQGVWAGLTLFMSLRMAAGFLRLGWKGGPWWFLHQDEHKIQGSEKIQFLVMSFYHVIPINEMHHLSPCLHFFLMFHIYFNALA